jgi:hypothetical protein
VTPRKTTKQSRVIKYAEKKQEFDPNKEKHTFEEVKKEFRRDQASSSRDQPKVRECGMPLAFDQSASPREGKEVSKLMEFLCTYINLIKDERIIQDLQNVIRQYELGKVDLLLNKEVHQLSKKRRKIKELHLNAQIGEYDIDYVVLDLASEVNVIMKKTWELMGKPKLIYSPMRLRMANQYAMSPFERLEHVPMDIDGVKKFVDFKVIEIVDDRCPYPVLFGIDWDFNSSIVVDLKKIRMMFEGDGLRVIAPLDPNEGPKYTEPIRE